MVRAKHFFPSRVPSLRANAAIPSRNGAPHGSIFSALRYRNYRLFWFGQLVSVTGTFMQGTAQQWLVLTLSSSPLALGIVGALQFGPLLVLAPFGGAIADRWPRRRVLMGTQASAGVLALILWALTATGVVQLWHVFVLATMLGLVNAVDMPTRQAFVSEMVPAERLLNAVSLNSAQFNASRIVGPGLAGGLIALLGGTPPLFLLNAVSYIAVIGGLLMMHVTDLVPVPHSEPQHGLARLRAMGDGIRFVMARPKLRVTFLMIAIIGTMGFNFNVLLPLEATIVLKSGAFIFGLLSSALGAGALVGALMLARRGGVPTNRMLVGMASTNPLISLTVTGKHSLNTAAAANALANIVVQQTTASYVGVKIRTFRATLEQVTKQIASVNKRLAIISAAERASRGLDPLQQLVVVSQEDNAETRLGNLIAQQETLQQQLAFATQVESARVVEPAKSLKASAHSRRTSLLVGALIGLIIGAIAAIVADTRARPA